MTVLMRVMPPQETDAGFGLLKDIIALAKNPEQIEEAHKRALDAAALTETEVAKLADDREFMAKADAARQELKIQEEALEQHRKEHAENIERARTEHTRKHNQLQLLSVELENKANAQAETDTHHRAERKALEEEKSSLQAGHDERMVKVMEREDAVKQGEATNVAESARLAEYKNKLDERAKKMMMAATEE